MSAETAELDEPIPYELAATGAEVRRGFPGFAVGNETFNEGIRAAERVIAAAGSSSPGAQEQQG